MRLVYERLGNVTDSHIHLPGGIGLHLSLADLPRSTTQHPSQCAIHGYCLGLCYGVFELGRRSVLSASKVLIARCSMPAEVVGDTQPHRDGVLKETNEVGRL